MLERGVGGGDQPIGIAGRAVEIRQRGFQRGAGVRQIVHGLAGIDDELVDVLAAPVEHAGGVADIDQGLRDRRAVLVIEHGFHPIRDDEQPRHQFGRIIEHLLQ